MGIKFGVVGCLDPLGLRVVVHSLIVLRTWSNDSHGTMRRHQRAETGDYNRLSRDLPVFVGPDKYCYSMTTTECVKDGRPFGSFTSTISIIPALYRPRPLIRGVA